MHRQIKGVFRDGKVELTEAPPAGIKQAEVVITFPDEKEASAQVPPSEPRYIYFGMFKGLRQSTEEDFKIAEWHGDADLDPDMPDAP
jgi:hypothetical protein